MSTRSVTAAEQILNNLLKAKGHSRALISEIGHAEREANRVLSLASQLGRGETLGLLLQLTRLGPYGIAAAAAVGAGIVLYEAYERYTAEKPSEIYVWSYPP